MQKSEEPYPYECFQGLACKTPLVGGGILLWKWRGCASDATKKWRVRVLMNGKKVPMRGAINKQNHVLVNGANKFIKIVLKKTYFIKVA